MVQGIRVVQLHLVADTIMHCNIGDGASVRCWCGIHRPYYYEGIPTVVKFEKPSASKFTK